MRISGKSVYKGIAMGQVVVLRDKERTVKREKIKNVQMEIARVESAEKKTKDRLQRLYEKALKETGKASASIFKVYQMMLEDEEYLTSVYNMIYTDMVNAEYAVSVTGNRFSRMFASMDNDYMQARAVDVKDVSNRLVRNLEGQEDIDFVFKEPVIVIANELSPSETVQMDKEKVLAFVTVHGSINSHTAVRHV